MKKRVEIDVEQLVLHGIQAGHQKLVRQVVDRELARIGTQREITPGRQLQIPEIRLPREGTHS